MSVFGGLRAGVEVLVRREIRRGMLLLVNNVFTGEQQPQAAAADQSLSLNRASEGSAERSLRLGCSLTASASPRRKKQIACPHQLQLQRTPISAATPSHLTHLHLAAPRVSSIDSMAPNMRSSAARSVLAQLQRAGTRSYANAATRPSLVANRAQWTPRPVSHQIALRQTIRQQSTDAPKLDPKTKKKGFRFLRWTWRATYLSAIAGVAWVGYGIWDMRHPDDQAQPDPTKKTLVVLGECTSSATLHSAPD